MTELSIADAVRSAREQRGLSVAALADRSGVSRAMIGKIERGDAQPTAQLLARIAAACELTLSRLIESAEARTVPLLRRHAEQAPWTDPATGYTRRSLSPATGGPLELSEVELPVGAVIGYAPGSYPVVPQQIWVLDGRLEVTQEGEAVTLSPGDCLALGSPGERRYANAGSRPCRYLVAAATAAG